MLLRLTIALICLAGAAAAALTWRDHERCQDATATVFAAALGTQSRAAEAGAIQTIRDDCRGTGPQLAVAGALHSQGRDAQALPLARDAVDAEPDNPAAWRALAAVASGAEGREADRRLRSLNPRIGRSSR